MNTFNCPHSPFGHSANTFSFTAWQVVLVLNVKGPKSPFWCLKRRDTVSDIPGLVFSSESEEDRNAQTFHTLSSREELALPKLGSS